MCLSRNGIIRSSYSAFNRNGSRGNGNRAFLFFRNELIEITHRNAPLYSWVGLNSGQIGLHNVEARIQSRFVLFFLINPSPHTCVCVECMHDVINDTIWCDGKRLSAYVDKNWKLFSNRFHSLLICCPQDVFLLACWTNIGKGTGWSHGRSLISCFPFFRKFVQTGWMFGKLDGRVGIFPADYVEPMSRAEARKISASSSRHTNQQVRQTMSLSFPSILFCFCFYQHKPIHHPQKLPHLLPTHKLLLTLDDHGMSSTLCLKSQPVPVEKNSTVFGNGKKLSIS